MLNNILKIGVGILCVYFMSQEEELKLEANVGFIENSNSVTMGENNYSSKAILSRTYQKLFDDLRNSGVIKPDSELIGIYMGENEIILNVNESFIYIGGIYREKEVINNIVEVGLNYEGIDYVTVLVDGKISETSEGLDLYRIDKIMELD